MFSLTIYKRFTRFFRTVFHLHPSQFLARVYCRSKFVMIEKSPKFYNEISKYLFFRIKEKPDFDNHDVGKLMDIISLLVNYDMNTHEDYISGSIYYLGRRVEFGSAEEINWNINLNEKNNPLWLMTLSYMSILIKIVDSDNPRKLSYISSIIKNFKENTKISNKGSTRSVWHPYAASHRLINYLTTLSYLDKDSDIKGEYGFVKDQLIDAAKENLAYVLLNLEYDLQFNHLLKNLVAIWLAKIYFNDIPISNFKLQKLTYWSIKQNFLLDGGHSERSPMYHNLGILDLMLLNFALPPSRLKKFVQQNISNAIEAAYGMSHINGDFAIFNDSWKSGAPSIKAIAGSSLLPDHYCQYLEETGYAKFTDTENSVIFDCGAAGPRNNLGHAHSDFLSYEYCNKTTKVITDFGTPTYSRGARRSLCRSSMVHNGPAIIGYEPMECWDSFKVGRRPKVQKINLQVPQSNEFNAIAAMHNGYKNLEISVGRLVCFFPNKGVFFIDIWHGNLGDHDLVVNLLTRLNVNESENCNIKMYKFLNKEMEFGALTSCLASTIQSQKTEIYDDFEKLSHGQKITITPKRISNETAISKHFISFSNESESSLVHQKILHGFQEEVKNLTSKLITELQKYNSKGLFK
jgi:hypothetical protein